MSKLKPKPVPVLKGKEADRLIKMDKRPLDSDERKDLEECVNFFRTYTFKK